MTIKILESNKFKRVSRKLSTDIKDRIEKQIRKILDNPEIGKPMRYNRQGTREIYIGSFRLSYFYSYKKEVVTLLDFYHKDNQ
jgi:mRNA-degrading endonuclease RelE of RelBE toxin-antitoxin system